MASRESGAKKEKKKFQSKYGASEVETFLLGDIKTAYVLWYDLHEPPRVSSFSRLKPSIYSYYLDINVYITKSKLALGILGSYPKMSGKVKAYREMQFSTETPHADFYTYSDVKDLPTKCEAQKHDVIKCRTVGILQSQYGHFYLYDLDATGVQTDSAILVSVVYLKTPPKSTVVPYPVQVFGTLQWVEDKPVLFVKILQVLTIPNAIRYKDIMSTISKQHLAEEEI